GELVVERRRAQWPRCLELLARPAHRVVQAERFAGASCERLAVRGERREAADVDVPQVTRRFAFDDPFGDQPAGAARVRDAGRVEAGGDKAVAQLGSLAE